MTELDEFEPITLEQVREAAREIAAALPDRVNPTGHGGVCVYTAPNDPTWHCIAGHLVKHLGLPVPSINGWFGSRAESRYFTEDAVTYVCVLQGTADIRLRRGHRPWSEVVRMVERDYELRP